MEDDKWSIDLSSTSSSRAYQYDPKFLSDLCVDFESLQDTDEYLMADYPCPYCEEDFDLVELCCHIDDEHQFESNSVVPKGFCSFPLLVTERLDIVLPLVADRKGLKQRQGTEATSAEDYMCPVCGLTEAVDMVGHITSQHGDMFKSLQKLKRRKGDFGSSPSFLKKDVEDDELSFYSQPSATDVSHTDRLLSFIHNMPSFDKAENAPPFLSTQIDAGKEKSEDKLFDSVASAATAPPPPPPLSEKEHMEKTKRSEFVQGLLLSTMFNDDL